MFERFADIKIGTAGGRALIVPRAAVFQPAGDACGPVEIRLNGRTRSVEWHAVRHRSREEVTYLLRTSLAVSLGYFALDLAWQLGLHQRDPEEVIDRVVEMLLGGTHVLVELPAEGIKPGPYRVRSESRPTDSTPRVAPEPQQGTRLHVRVVLDDGAALSGASVTLTGPDGRTAVVATGGGGDARLEELPADGLGRAVVQPEQVPRAAADAATLLHADHVFDFPFTSTVAAEVLTGPMQTLLLRRPEIDRVDTSNLAFAPGSVLLTALAEPLSPSRGLATAMERLQRGPACRLLLVGHASPDGSVKENEALALRRAQCVRHLLTGDRDGWVKLASEHGAPADVQRLLRYLAQAHEWPTEPTRTDGVVDDNSRSAVASFQTTYNSIFDRELEVDGVCGEQTLGALFDVQQHELRIQLDTAGVPEGPPAWFTTEGIVSAGARVLAHPAIPGSESADGQRRVDALLIPEDIGWRESHGIERLYDVARLRLLPLSPLAVGPRDLILQLVDHYGRVLAGEPYRLTTDDEAREGTSDAEGMVTERNLQGRSPRIECGDAVIVIDDRYHQMTRARHERVPVFGSRAEDPDDPDWDAPLPAANDDDDEGDVEDTGDDDDDDADETAGA